RRFGNATECPAPVDGRSRALSRIRPIAAPCRRPRTSWMVPSGFPGRSQRRPPHWGDGTRSEYDPAHELLHQADEHGSLVAMGEERTEGPATSEMPRWYEPTGSVPAWQPRSAYGDAGGSGTGGSDHSGGGHGGHRGGRHG